MRAGIILLWGWRRLGIGLGLEFDDLDVPVAPSNWMMKLGAYSVQQAEQSQLEKLDKKQAKADRETSKAEKKGRKHERKAERKQNKESKNVKKIPCCGLTSRLTRVFPVMMTGVRVTNYC